MKYILTLLLSGILILCHAQRFSGGVISGTGFSDYHGNFISGKWNPKPGTIAGAFMRYSLTSVLGFETGMEYTTQSYHFKSYGYAPSNQFYPMQALRYIIGPTVPSWETARWDYSFVRFPLYLTVSTPTRLRVSLSGGIYVSRTVNHDFSGNGSYNYPDYSNSVYTQDPEPEVPKFDNGMAFASSLSYPAGKHLMLQVSGRYFIGHKAFIEPYGGRTGAKELTIGIVYGGPFTTDKSSSPGVHGDTAKSRLLLVPVSGIGFSWADRPDRPKDFGSGWGMSAGMLLEYKLDNALSAISGLMYEPRGYCLNDSSSEFYRHAQSLWLKYDVNTRIDLNYAVIPVLLKIHGGSPFTIYLMGGPYFGMLLNARATGKATSGSSYSGGYVRNEVTVYNDIEGNIRSFDFGWIIGGGFQFPLPGSCVLTTGIQYDTGTVNILKHPEEKEDVSSVTDRVLHNRSLRLQIGIAIPIHKI
jgi:hypothetical protein